MKKVLAALMILTLLVGSHFLIDLALGETPDTSPSVSDMQKLVDKTIEIIRLQDELIVKQDEQINILYTKNILLIEKIRILEIVIENLEKKQKLSEPKTIQPKNNSI